ncbi:MAG: zinc-ribbon domain-containing protein [Acutalibacteraceae bacterium]
MPYCKKCGNEINPNHKFCIKCGTAITQAAPPQPKQQPQANNKRICPVCGSDLKENQKFCIKCGTPVTKSEQFASNSEGYTIKERNAQEQQPDIPDSQAFSDSPTYKSFENQNSDSSTAQVFSDESAVQNKTNIKALIIAIIGLLVLVSLVVILPNVYCSGCNTHRSTKTSSSLSSSSQSSRVDNSVNGMGYYYFDNTLDEAIEKYRDIVEKTDDSSLENTVDNITLNRMIPGGVSTFLDIEQVTDYSYTYYNKDTAIYLWKNDKNKIVAATYMYNSNVRSDYKYSSEARSIQLVNKPAKWLYALSDILTYNQAFEIYKTLFTEHLNAVIDAKEGNEPILAHYYKGYSMLINGNASTEAITIVKTDSDFIEKHNIKAGRKSIFSEVEISTNSGTSSQSTEPPTSAPCPESYEQKVEVVSSGTTATLTLYEWQNGKWKSLMTTNATVGQNGVGINYGEGEKITPQGTFDLGFCYGLSKPDTKLEFTKLEYGSIFVCDSSSKYYNCLTSMEHFNGANIENTYAQFAEQNKYNYNIFIEHNGDGKTPNSATPGKGSVITICGYNGTLKPTWGCIDITTTAMTELLSYLDSSKNPVIIIS